MEMYRYNRTTQKLDPVRMKLDPVRIWTTGSKDFELKVGELIGLFQIQKHIEEMCNQHQKRCGLIFSRRVQSQSQWVRALR